MPRKSRTVAVGSAFSFRWGIPVLDNLPFTVLYHFLLDHYAELGVDPLEMMFIVHLSQFRHETPDGKAAPGLPHIAELMGYKDEQQVRRIKKSLLAKGMLRVTPQSGRPDIYDVAPFAAAAWRLWEEEQRGTPIGSDTPIQNDSGIQTASPTTIRSDRGGLSELIGEKEGNKNENEMDRSSPAKQPLRYSAYIAGVVLEHAGELNSPARGAAGVGEALSLWMASGLSEAEFVQRLNAARDQVRQRPVPGADKWGLYMAALRESH